MNKRSFFKLIGMIICVPKTFLSKLSSPSVQIDYSYLVAPDQSWASDEPKHIPITDKMIQQQNELIYKIADPQGYRQWKHFS